MKRFLIIIGLIVTLTAKSQIERYFIYDTINVGSYAANLDTVFFFKNEISATGIDIFFDKTQNNLALSCFFIEDTMFVTTFFKSGKIKGEDTFLDKYIQIRERRWCENGQIIRDVLLNNDIISIENFYCDGKLQNKFFLKEAVLIGEYFWWYSNGQLKEKGSYVDNNKDGEWKYYFENGELKSVEIYENGKQLKATDYSQIPHEDK